VPTLSNPIDKTMDPKISVIIPTYNRAKLLSRAIQSVLNQTYSNFELIVIDDGSPDNTKKIVEEFQKKDKRIKYIWQENFGGNSKTINTGIKASQGEYIALLEDDDEWLPEKLEKQLEVFQNSKREKLGLVCCKTLTVYENGKTEIIKTCDIPENNYKVLAESLLDNKFFFNVSAFLIKKEALDKVGFLDENLKIGTDKDILLRIFKDYNFDFAPFVLVRYYDHGGKFTRMPFYDRFLKDLLYLHTKHHDIYKNYPKIYSREQRGIGNYYVLLGDCKQGRKYFLRSIGTYPFNLKSYQSLLLSFLGSRVFIQFSNLKRKINNYIF
jgi:glycosyltransferase involved in cell wall biosynthesis